MDIKMPKIVKSFKTASIFYFTSYIWGMVSAYIYTGDINHPMYRPSICNNNFCFRTGSILIWTNTKIQQRIF